MITLAGLIIACLTVNVYGSSTPYIVGGNKALDGRYPYQISLREPKPRPKYSEHFCGGAIISKNHVITAASCVAKFENPYVLNIIAGSNKLNSGKHTKTYRVTEILLNPNYDPIRSPNCSSLPRNHDIALLHVSNNIHFNEYIKPAILPETDGDYENYPLVATGWGSIRAGGPISNDLRGIVLKGFSQAKCNSQYGGGIKKSHICTLTISGEGICNGDFGGPLTADGVLVGIASCGKSPCASGYADVFTKVFSYRSWIRRYAGV